MMQFIAQENKKSIHFLEKTFDFLLNRNIVSTYINRCTRSLTFSFMNKSDLDITIIPFEEYRECMLCSDSRKESGLNVPHSVDISEKFCKKIQD